MDIKKNIESSHPTDTQYGRGLRITDPRETSVPFWIFLGEDMVPNRQTGGTQYFSKKSKPIPRLQSHLN